MSRVEHFLDYPDIQLAADPTRKTDGVTQFETAASWFTSKKAARANRLFVAGGFGTSFGGHPLPTEQYPIGGLLRLGAFDVGAFDEWEHLTWSTNLSLGVIADTIIGPVFGGFSFGFEGGTRFYIAIGQLFR